MDKVLLKSWMKENKYSLEDVASLIGVSRETVRIMLKGHAPKARALLKLEEASGHSMKRWLQLNEAG